MSYLFSWLRGGDLIIYYGVSYGSLDTAAKISNQPSVRSCLSMTPQVVHVQGYRMAFVTEGWLEIDKHYSLELCFSIEKQPETVW